MAEEKEGRLDCRDQLTQIEEKLRRKVDVEFKDAVDEFIGRLTRDHVRSAFMNAFDGGKSMMAAYDYDPAMAILRLFILNEVGACANKDGTSAGEMLVKKAQWWSEEVRGKATQRTIDELLDGAKPSPDTPDTHVTIVGKRLTVSSMEVGEITDEHRQRLEEGGISKEEVDGSA